MNKGKTITKTIGYVDKLTGDVIPINEVLAAAESARCRMLFNHVFHGCSAMY